MDRCQSEQLWAIASYLAVTVFLVTHIAEGKIDHGKVPAAIVGMLVLFLVTTGFLWDRLENYYRHRHSLTKLSAKLPNAPAYMKADFGISTKLAVARGVLSKQASFWIIIYVLVLVSPFAGYWLLFEECP